MDKAIVILVVIGLAVACFAVAGLAGGAMEAETEAHRTETQAVLVQAETERAEVEILQESQRTLEDVATAAMAEAQASRAEARTERARAQVERERADRIQAEYHQLALEALKERDESSWSSGLVAVMIVAVVGVAVVLLLLRRWERVIVILSPGVPTPPWLTAGSGDIVTWEEQVAIRHDEVIIE